MNSLTPTNVSATSTESQLIELSSIIGSIADSNASFTLSLARYINKIGKPLAEITLSELAAIVKSCKDAFNTGIEPKIKQINTSKAKTISLAELLASEEHARGFTPDPLDQALLLKRVKDGGHSGQFLSDAFISSYRTQTPFKHSLGEIMKLDYEAIRLFHQILHIRFISGWSDAVLYDLEQEIIAINGGKS